MTAIRSGSSGLCIGAVVLIDEMFLQSIIKVLYSTAQARMPLQKI
jgi:hypothetical protein